MIYEGLTIVDFPPAAHVAYVCGRLRAADAEEAYATLDRENPEALAAHFIALAPHCFIWRSIAPVGKPPAVLLGVVRQHAGVGQAFMVATDRFEDIGSKVTRYVRRVVIPELRAGGFHRIEARALAASAVNCRWLESIGARRETDLTGYGKRGELFAQYALVQPTMRSHRWRRPVCILGVEPCA